MAVNLKIRNKNQVGNVKSKDPLCL